MFRLRNALNLRTSAFGQLVEIRSDPVRSRFLRVLLRVDVRRYWYAVTLLVLFPLFVVLLWVDDWPPKGVARVGHGFALVAWAVAASVFAYALYRDAKSKLVKDEQ